MAKQRRHAALALAPLALLLSQPSQASWKFTPTLELRETYTDNLRLARSGREQSDWITEVTPGFTVAKRSDQVRFDATYRLHYFAGADDIGEEVDRAQSALAARLAAEVVGDWLYFDGTANISQQPVSAFGPLLSRRSYAAINQTELRSFSASPYLRHRFGSTATVELRYVRDKVDTGRERLGNSDGETVALSVVSGSRFADLGWNLLVREQRIDDELAPETSAATASAGLRYSLSRTMALTGNVGYDKYDYAALGGVTEGRSWSTGFIYTPSSRTRIDASAGRRFYGDSYHLSANHRARRAAFSLSYSDAVTNSRSQFLLPSTVDTAALLDSLFLSAFPDPVARRQAVEAYMQATGLPPSLADSINYFSNRYFLQKQLRAAVVLRGSRTRTVFTGFGTRRTALSTAEADSAILGPSSLTLNDNTSQRGASALWSYRLDGKTDFNASLQTSRVESITTGVVRNHTETRLSLTHQFERKLSGVIEVRHVTGPITQGFGKYVENALSAGVLMQF
ncbi:TIGR03016 family PEP-CTERM system-associated outer membrane protein [Massilia sp. GCM10020059]|uniref:TIGR03016 family PEP-CTERM system-associated outer membrane protein n=1 Tax=Massilia agrisoli TaxID=2892444 RepID=A0ABS8IQ35_9BURK|nr:TIGR03016 family PEP-CTERM system-associated outer membrane protein [Massilia agrisoli]MCC6070629.1 TIGR03016 family PEP-CTERM system-associated outer membrane protein [Massilia agrisoli]